MRECRLLDKAPEPGHHLVGPGIVVWFPLANHICVQPKADGENRLTADERQRATVVLLKKAIAIELDS